MGVFRRRTARRPGAWARKRAFEAMRASARAAWLPIVGILTTTAISIAGTQLAASTWWRGFSAGSALVLGLGSIPLILLLTSESAIARYMGAGAEKLTGEVLAKRRWRRSGWHAFHGLQLGGHDIDHVAVGPGGVLAIETKWCGGRPWRVEGDALVGPVGRDPLAQARRSARKVGAFLSSVTGGAPVATTVDPVLVAWGPGAPRIGAAPCLVGGVLLVQGGIATQWDAVLGGARSLDPAVLEAASRKFGAFAEAQWKQVRAEL